MKMRNVSKFNVLLLVVVLLCFFQEYRFLLNTFEKQNLISVERDFRTISTGVSGMLNNFQYGSAITLYRIETLSRQTLRYNVNYINEKIVGTEPKNSKVLAEDLRKVMAAGEKDNFIILGLYDNVGRQFLIGNDYFKTESPVSENDLSELMEDARHKGEAYTSFALSREEDVFNRVDVFMRYNPALHVTVIGAIPRMMLKSIYEDNVNTRVVHNELVGSHTKEKEGYILIYDANGKLKTTNWAHSGNEYFLKDNQGRLLYGLVKKKQEQVLDYITAPSPDGPHRFYAYADTSGDHTVIVLKDQATEDRHKRAAEMFLKIITVIMLGLIIFLIYLILAAKPQEK